MPLWKDGTVVVTEEVTPTVVVLFVGAGDGIGTERKRHPLNTKGNNRNIHRGNSR